MKISIRYNEVLEIPEEEEDIIALSNCIEMLFSEELMQRTMKGDLTN